MRYLVEAITRSINTITAGNAETSIIRLDHMPHPQIYLEVCHKLRKTRGSSFQAHLAREKYLEFEAADPSLGPILNQLRQEGYVDTDGRMTYWRNSSANASGLILLMGTEAVEDRGGLADFYAITPSSIERELRRDYSSWIGDLIPDLTESSNAKVRRFFEKLFQHVPCDLLNLSRIFEEVEAHSPLTADGLVELLSDRLNEDWGIPRISGRHAIERTLALIDKAVQFRDRTNYSDGLTEAQRKRILKRFERYTSAHPEVAAFLNDAYSVAFSSFEDFKQSVIDYLSGISLDRNRDALFQCDFSLIADILDTPVRAQTAPKPPKLKGDPLEVIIIAMFRTCQAVMNTGEPVEELQYEIDSVQLAGCTTDDELRCCWQNITYWAGGIMDFLSRESWSLGEREIRISWGHAFDPFSPLEVDAMIESGFVRKALPSKKLSTIEFQISVLPSQQSFSYVWEFEPLNSWSQAFTVLGHSLRDIVEDEDSRYLPIGSCTKIPGITELTNEDDFLAAMEGISVSFTNLMDIIQERLGFARDVVGYSAGLADRFASFAKDLWTNGFYSTFVGADASGVRLVSYYSEVIRHLSKESYPANVEQWLHLISNAFLITPSQREGLEDKAVSAALVPPFHPAMLEKMQAQAQFIREGAAELLKHLETESSSHIAYRFDRLLQLSTITSGVDVLIGPRGECLPAKNTFAYHSLHQSREEREIVLSSLLSTNYDVVSDDESSLGELRRATPLSRLFARQVEEYLETYPFQGDELSLLFVNPPDLQPVVSGVHEVVQRLRKQPATVRIKLHVLLPSLLQHGRNYLRYWLDNYFTEEDNVTIQTFCNGLDLKKSNLRELRRDIHVDIAFVQNPLETTTCKFERITEELPSIVESRFPMVYPPLPVSKTSVQRFIAASQTQFEAAHLHTQLARKLTNKDLRDGTYRLVKELRLNEKWEEFLNLLHEVAHWVVCIDSGIDRDVLHRSTDRIISFSTGEGPFGEYNYTVSSNQAVQTDIAERLKAQLRRKFPSWPADSLADVAKNCLARSKQLDGIRLLRALNPNDYGIHNFLAYILTAETFELAGSANPGYVVRALISLDAYAHWFEDKSVTKKRPDFLLLEIPKDGGLHIKATLIECKIGERSEHYVDKASKQLREGYVHLSSRWDPESTDVDRRYWYAQLYRALVFSKINLEDNSPEYQKFVGSLDNLLSGQFSINWAAQILAFWLDENRDEMPSVVLHPADELETTYRPFGQLYIQRMLRSPEHRQESITFLIPEPRELTDDVEEASVTLWGSVEEQEDADVLSAIDPEELVGEPSTGNSRTADVLKLDEAETTAVGIKSEAGVCQDDESSSISTCRTSQQSLAHRSNLEDIRVLIGVDVRTGERVYWEYGHPQLPNRHILISGNSGTGKTYLIQSMMLELSRSGIPCVVFDYTDGFTYSKLEPEFKQYLADRIIEFPVYHKPFPINPFKRYEIEIAGHMSPQKPVDVAERIKSVFQAVYGFGDQQASAIYRATRTGLEKYGDTMNLRHLQSQLRDIASEIPNAKTVLSKIEPLVDREPFDNTNTQNWARIHESNGSILIVQLSGFTRDVQLLITEIILWDAWYYNVKYGRKDLPFPVILDEAQNLDHGDRSPSTMILTEGRKFGWSGWFATQFMKGQLRPDEIQRLQQASQKVYFNPPEAEIPDIANAIEPDRERRPEWYSKLSQLRKGECVVVGYELRGGKLRKCPPRIVSVSSISERIVRP